MTGEYLRCQIFGQWINNYKFNLDMHNYSLYFCTSPLTDKYFNSIFLACTFGRLVIFKEEYY